MSKTKQIAPTPENAVDVRERYYGKPALFMEEILGMDLDDWQRDMCEQFHLKDKHAVSSGHSSGKTAFVAGIMIYFVAVHPDPQVITTANTELQLSQKTWRELAKWHNKSLLRDWFQWTATKFSLKGAEETWFAAAVPNTPHGAEGFAGAHEKYILQIFDEASAIERIIWETAEGATATKGGYRKWLVFGNPTRNDGAFFDCFHKNSHRWNTRYLDTRECKYADQGQIEEWLEDYGEDSDFFRVRVRGLFPKVSVIQLIGRDLVETATARTALVNSYDFAPKILGVDVARFGDDETVFTKRQGLKVYPQTILSGKDTMEVASEVADIIEAWHPQAVFIDETGIGAGVVDRLVQLKFKPIGVASSSKASSKLYLNKRIEMWDKLKEWLKNADIPDDQRLSDDLTGPEYFYNTKGLMQLESKLSMKKRGLHSPDRADSLAITFAYPVRAVREEKVLPQAELDWQKVTGNHKKKAKVMEDAWS